jgi:mono/diheme cytochrome c family protein
MSVRVHLAALLALAAGGAWANPEDRPYSGEHVYMLYCEGCHKPGPEGPGTRVLAARLGWEKAALKGRTDLQPDYVRQVVRNGLLEMAPLRPTDINDEELDRLIEYMRTPGPAPTQPTYQP